MSVEEGVSDVLSRSRLKTGHPGDARLGQVYPTPADSVSVLAETVSNRGQLRVASNSNTFGSQSNFIVSSSALLSNFMLNFYIRKPADGVAAYMGWGFGLIDSIEITLSNSMMQSMFIRGDTLKSFALLTCRSKDERERMLLSAGPIDSDHTRWQDAGGNFGSLAGGDKYYYCCVPLFFLNNNASSCDGTWPLDGSVLAGPIQITVTWKSNPLDVFVKSRNNGPEPSAPITLYGLELSCQTTVLQDAAFSVKRAMMQNPSLIYSLPSKYIVSTVHTQNVSHDDSLGKYNKFTLNLSSAPSGMLEALLIDIKPTSALSRGMKPGFSVMPYYTRLSFGGQNLIRYESSSERRQYIRAQFGDDLTYETLVYNPGGLNVDAGHYGLAPLSTTVVTGVTYVPGENPGVTYTTTSIHQEALTTTYGTGVGEILVLPLTYNARRVFQGYLNENLPSYGGAQLQLELGLEDTYRVHRPDCRSTDVSSLVQRSQFIVGGSTSNLAEGDSLDVEGTEFTITIGYVISSLLEVSQGTVDLQL